MNPTDDSTPLATIEAEFASWLATLDSTTAPAAARAQAVTRLATAFMQSRESEARLHAAASKATAEVKRLGAVLNSVLSVLQESERPAPQTSAGCACAQLGAPPGNCSRCRPALRIVRPEGA